MDSYGYERRELTRVLEAGPRATYTHFFLKVEGAVDSRCLALTPDTLRKVILAICGEALPEDMEA